MNNRALIGLSAAAMSALVATAVGCGEPQQKTYTPAEEPAATVEAPATTEAETTETEAAEPEAAEADKAEETAEPAADEKAEETTEAEGDKAEQADEKVAPSADDSKAEKPAAGEKAEGAKADDKAEEPAAGDKAEQAAPAAEAAALTDGEYTAEGKGIGGKVPVTVTVKDGKIAEVTVGENSETQGIGSKAIEQLPAKIVEAGGTEGVDAVSGASVTSKAIFTAVEDCLKQAK
ncbi:MAG: FMN-binding protein [Coriobacteriaceae bacterium]|nr:FMN-binding protein [Coriobacteriaceae bacterium]